MQPTQRSCGCGRGQRESDPARFRDPCRAVPPTSLTVTAATVLVTAKSKHAAVTAGRVSSTSWLTPTSRLGDIAWNGFIPPLDYDVENRRLRGANAIEPLNARYRRALRDRGHFPHRTERRGNPALSAFAITFGDRFSAAEGY